MAQVKTIIVPIDDTELADSVLDAALTVGGVMTAGKVVILSVQSDPATLEQYKTDMALDDIEAFTRHLEQRAIARLEGTGLDASAIVGEVRSGSLETTILAAAEDHMARLIVMGTHGRKGLTDQLTGSSSERVVAKSSCSVLVVKPEGFPYLRA